MTLNNILNLIQKEWKVSLSGLVALTFSIFVYYMDYQKNGIGDLLYLYAATSIAPALFLLSLVYFQINKNKFEPDNRDKNVIFILFILFITPVIGLATMMILISLPSYRTQKSLN